MKILSRAQILLTFPDLSVCLLYPLSYLGDIPFETLPYSYNLVPRAFYHGENGPSLGRSRGSLNFGVFSMIIYFGKINYVNSFSKTFPLVIHCFCYNDKILLRILTQRFSLNFLSFATFPTVLLSVFKLSTYLSLQKSRLQLPN